MKFIDMKSSCAVVIAILLLFLIGVSISESRKELAGIEYWRNVMKDQAMPKAIHDLIIPQTIDDKITNNLHENNFAGEFEPTPNLSAYPDDDERKTDSRIGAELEAKPFTKDFKPSSTKLFQYNYGQFNDHKIEIKTVGAKTTS